VRRFASDGGADPQVCAGPPGPAPRRRGQVPATCEKPAGGPARRTAGFTLLELIVSTVIMSIAVVGLLSGLAGSTHNAARLRDYDRMVQVARLRMNDLLVDRSLAPGAPMTGAFDPQSTGGLEAGWQARISIFEHPPTPPAPDQLVLDRIQLDVWWMTGVGRKTFTLEAFRGRMLTPEMLQ
jgi:prepilin-type N-terminal cleavage/methylation domain-containing protein